MKNDGRTAHAKGCAAARIAVAALLLALACGCGRKDDLQTALARYENRRLAADGRGIIYIMRDYKILRSRDSGRTWSEPDTVPADGYPVWGYSIASDGRGLLYFVHIGTGKGKKTVYVSRSSDGGRSWTDPVAASEDVWAQRSDPRIAVSGENVYVAWIERSEMGPSGIERPSGVYFTSSQDGGRSWGKDIWLREGEDCWLTLDETGAIYLSYTGRDDGSIIYVSHSEDRGQGWRTETSGELRMALKEPYAVSLSTGLYLFFQGGRPAPGQLSPAGSLEYRTYWTVSKDGGKTWSGITMLEGGTR